VGAAVGVSAAAGAAIGAVNAGALSSYIASRSKGQVKDQTSIGERYVRRCRSIARTANTS
jgi:hypothetical protein